MKDSGVNMVARGSGTAGGNFMLDVGAPDESAFRALDAFLSPPEAPDSNRVTLFASSPKHGAG